MSKVSTDPIADMLTRVRNAMLVRKNIVKLPHSKQKESIAKILKENHYIDDVSVEDAIVGKTLLLTINDENSNSRITDIKRMSKPGRRHYTSANNIPRIKRGRGIVIVSTSKGLMTGDKAAETGLGGEVICSVY